MDEEDREVVRKKKKKALQEERVAAIAGENQMIDDHGDAILGERTKKPVIKKMIFKHKRIIYLKRYVQLRLNLIE